MLKGREAFMRVKDETTADPPPVRGRGRREQPTSIRKARPRRRGWEQLDSQGPSTTPVLQRFAQGTAG